VLSGTGLYIGLITSQEESYRMFVCVSVIVKPQGGGPGPLGAVAPWEEINQEKDGLFED